MCVSVSEWTSPAEWASCDFDTNLWASIYSSGLPALNTNTLIRFRIVLWCFLFYKVILVFLLSYLFELDHIDETLWFHTVMANIEENWGLIMCVKNYVWNSLTCLVKLGNNTALRTCSVKPYKCVCTHSHRHMYPSVLLRLFCLSWCTQYFLSPWSFTRQEMNSTFGKS